MWPLEGEPSQPAMLQLPRAWVEPIRAAAAPLQVIAPESPEAALSAAAGAHGWIGALTPELFRAATALRWLQAPTISLEALQFDELNTSTVTVTNMRHIYDDHIANHVIALFLAHCRELPRFWRQQQRREWISGYIDSRALDPAQLTVLIQGLGGIGSELARRLRVFGPRVIGVDPQRDAAPEGVDELARPAQLPALLGRADAVIVAAPQTPETLGMYDEAMFRRMKPNAFFVNIGRGPIVREAALERALREGWIAAAAIDVVEAEPLPPTSPLWALDNLMITPHCAGAGPFGQERRLAVIVDNVKRFAAGHALANVVDLARGY